MSEEKKSEEKRAVEMSAAARERDAWWQIAEELAYEAEGAPVDPAQVDAEHAARAAKNGRKLIPVDALPIPHHHVAPAPVRREKKPTEPKK